MWLSRPIFLSFLYHSCKLRICVGRSFSVAPRLRATGLPHIASPEIMSSGNAQHIGTEITASLIIIQVHRFGIHLLRGMAAHLVRQQYLHYLCHISGPRYERRDTLRQRNNGVMELHSTGTLLGHGLVRKVRHTRIFRHSFSCIWHDTPGQYIECTCKLTTAKSSG